MEQESAQDRIIAEFKSDVEKMFPDLPVAEWGYGFDYHASIGASNYLYRKSKYFVDPANKTFFHLTSYSSFYAIINSATIRLYNLLNSKDENELDSYAEAGLTTDQIKNIKEGIFSFSSCETSDIESKQMWKNYGKVAIVFEIINDPKKWNNFHFAKVEYKRGEFSKYFALESHYRERYKAPFRFESLSKLIAFHKIPTLDWESEVRLLYTPSLRSIYEEGIYDDFRASEYHTGHTKYIELPLYVDPTDKPGYSYKWLRHTSKANADDLISKPLLKIKTVIFGDNEDHMDQARFNELRPEIDHYVAERLGYRVDIQHHLFDTGVKKNSGQE